MIDSTVFFFKYYLWYAQNCCYALTVPKSFVQYCRYLADIVSTLGPTTHKAFREGLFSQLLHLILSLEYLFVPPRDSSTGNLVHVIARVPRRCEFSIHPGLSCCRFYLSRCDTILHQLRSKSIHYHVKAKGFFYIWQTILPDRSCSWTAEDHANLTKESSFPHRVEHNRFIVLGNNFNSTTVNEVHLQNRKLVWLG